MAGHIRRAASSSSSRLALEGGEEVLTQLLWDVVLQVGSHEQVEALVVDGLRKDRTGQDRTGETP